MFQKNSLNIGLGPCEFFDKVNRMRRSFQKPSSASAVSNTGAKCQKCLKEGHWTADCTNERDYTSRPSRTALRLNPKLKLPEANLIKDDFVDERYFQIHLCVCINT